MMKMMLTRMIVVMQNWMIIVLVTGGAKSDNVQLIELFSFLFQCSITLTTDMSDDVMIVVEQSWSSPRVRMTLRNMINWSCWGWSHLMIWTIEWRGRMSRSWCGDAQIERR